jgi:hypothetical protein
MFYIMRECSCRDGDINMFGAEVIDPDGQQICCCCHRGTAGERPGWVFRTLFEKAREMGIPPEAIRRE